MINLIEGMKTCNQTEGMTILEHGLSVSDYFEDLYNHLYYGEPLRFEWRLPDWIYNPLLTENCFNLKKMKTYLIFHDCGKPLCLYFDEEGKRHFPDHARISQEAWLNAGGSEDIGRLIRMDMDIHLLKSENVDQFCENEEAISLLLAGLAEVHSNAGMFGGIESTSFKIKWKHINKKGKQIISFFENKPTFKISA